MLEDLVALGHNGARRRSKAAVVELRESKVQRKQRSHHIAKRLLKLNPIPIPTSTCFLVLLLLRRSTAQRPRAAASHDRCKRRRRRHFLWLRHRALMFRKLVVRRLTPDFRAATEIVSLPVPAAESLARGTLLVRTRFVGVNASDVNFTAGKYTPGLEPPFDCGFEAVGEVVACGPGTRLPIGQPVVATSFGAFSEMLVIEEKRVVPVPVAEPSVLPLFVSGLTASIALERVAQLKAGETILVTAGAGGTGVFACQIAKHLGCRVIATCSSDDKAALLRSLGVDRPVVYTREDLASVLRDEFADGVDVVYESVGGDMFEIGVDALARHGRLVVIGFISGYADGSGWRRPASAAAASPALASTAAATPASASSSGTAPLAAVRGDRRPLAVKLLAKSASVRGFFLNDFLADWKTHLERLVGMVRAGTLRPVVDTVALREFRGLEGIAGAVDYMYARKNTGKVVVEIDPTGPDSNRSSRL